MSVLSLSLAGEVAIITGGRRGIGKAIALAFAQAGADVAVCDIVTDDGQLMSVAEEIQKMGSAPWLSRLIHNLTPLSMKG